MAQGRIGAWGITAFEVPSAVTRAMAGDPPPAAGQFITNPLDSAGEMAWSDEPLRPRDLIAAARERGTGVMGIRAVGAGALTDGLDRELAEDHATARDFRRAAGFREVARRIGESPASLAHRYALSMDGVDTVILGVKDRAELRDCLDAEARGPLAAELIGEIEASVAAATI